MKDSFIKSRQIAEQHRQQKIELEKAAKVQDRLLPTEFPAVHKYAAMYLPMEGVGGDLYDVIDIDSEHTGIYLGDVSGHGMPAALMSVGTKKDVGFYGSNLDNPAEFFELLNSEFFKLHSGDENNYFTAFYGIINNKDRSIKYSTGAHEAPILIKKDSKSVVRLATKGDLLGAFNGFLKTPSWEEKVYSELENGDRILVFSDGITECKRDDGDDNGEEFGSERLVGFMLDNFNLDPDAFIKKLEDVLIEYRGSDNFEDDVTVLLIEIKFGD